MRLPERMEIGLRADCPCCGTEPGDLCINIFNKREIVDRVHLTRFLWANQEAAE